MHIEQLGAAVGGLYLFSKVIGVIKALIWSKDFLSKATHDDREEYIYAHVLEDHEQPFNVCLTNQCAAL